jgi:uncharacterized circularly permuted ATP-grasp superfamily protein
MTAPTPADEARPDDPGAAAASTDVLAVLERVDRAALREDVAARIAAAGVRFGGERDGWPFVVDPVPRIFSGEAWDRLAAGLQQRVRALDAFVRDAYGARRAVSAGIVTDADIEGTDGYEPLLRHAWPEHGPPLGVSGLDVVRDHRGALLVLEDNLRTPSGSSYAVAAREAVTAALADAGIPVPPLRELAGPVVALFAAALGAAAPPDVDEPAAVVLSDGPAAGAYYEHAWVAARLGVPVVTLADLEPDGAGGLRRRDAAGRAHRVDVVYRRTGTDLVHAPGGGLTPVAEALLRPWLDGRLGLVNGFGTGVADDKLVHARVERLIELYLGEAPLLPSVPGLALGEPGALAEVLADPRAFVIKARYGEGGTGVTVCRDATDAALALLLDAVRADPAAWMAQRTVALSTHPTITPGGAVEPRHVDLRPYVFATPDGPRTAPGGLTRVALTRGSLVVNSSQQGGAKDTWVLA